MKDITILSGKGGTGKTCITAALATVATNTVFCDNDVDAADLHLLFDPQIVESHSFLGAWEPIIDNSKCTQCGLCQENCRFDAIHPKEEGGLVINKYQCEGCRLCERICPAEAITSKQSTNNQWFVSSSRFGSFVHARMGPGEENSGKLVTQIRKKAREIAKATNADFIVNDGPPGIGCATIASITGAHATLIVIEPTRSGLHDAQRLVELIQSFKIPIFAIINKHDLNEEIALVIKQYLNEQTIPLVAEIPFDPKMVNAMIDQKTIVEFDPEGEISKQIKTIWETISISSN
jgi:MinD superfamily P-loop ATPase